MTREEAKEILSHNWTRVDNPNYSESELDEAFFMAIEALSAEQGGRYENAMQKLREMPRYLNGVKEKQITKISADDEPKWSCAANFVAEQLEKLEDMTVSEKLKLIQDLLGVEFKEENLNYKHTSAEADRPSGEWTYLHGSIGSYMTISCPFCGKTFNDVAEWEYNYCPSCGARMKGGAE